MAWDEDEIYWPHDRYGKDKSIGLAEAHLRTDAVYCSVTLRGNPGRAKVRWTDSKKKVLGEYEPDGRRTVNEAELICLAKAVQHASQTGGKVVYSGSRVALAWIAKEQEDGDLFARLAALCARKAAENGISFEFWNKRMFGRLIPSDFGKRRLTKAE